MASFDIIEAAGKGYFLIWRERRYLIRLALVPVLLKFTCYMTVLGLGWQANMIRYSLVMLPRYFAEGWLFAHIIRLIFFQQRWPFRPSGNAVEDMRALEDRARGVTAGTLCYVVIKFISGGLLALGTLGVPAEGPAKDAVPLSAAEPGLLAFVVSVLLVFAAIWALRLMWLYIPAAINYSLIACLRKLNGFTSSLYLLGTWMICYIPLFFTTLLIMDVFMQGWQGQEDSFGALLSGYIANLFYIVVDTLIGMISTAGIAYGLGVVLFGQKKEES